LFVEELCEDIFGVGAVLLDAVFAEDVVVFALPGFGKDVVCVFQVLELFGGGFW